jgi:hypothetical protein
VVNGCKEETWLKIRIQSVETGLFLTRAGTWTTGKGAALCHEPMKAIELCVRLGVKKVRFNVWHDQASQQAYVYPFGGDPAARSYRRQLRKTLAEQRRARASFRQLQARVKGLQMSAA